MGSDEAEGARCARATLAFATFVIMTIHHKKALALAVPIKFEEIFGPRPRTCHPAQTSSMELTRKLGCVENEASSIWLQSVQFA